MLMMEVVMKYFALVMLVSSIFAGSASAHGVMHHRYCGFPICGGYMKMDKDKMQNMMYFNMMHNHWVIMDQHGHVVKSTVWPMPMH